MTEMDAGHGATPRMLAAARAIAEALFATESGAPPADRLAWLARELDDFLARCGARARIVFRLSLFAVSVLAPLMIYKVTALRSLHLDDRSRALDRLEKSRFALPLLAVKAMLCFLYYEHPDAARDIGFDARCMTVP